MAVIAGSEPVLVVITHYHRDHVGGNAGLQVRCPPWEPKERVLILGDAAADSLLAPAGPDVRISAVQTSVGIRVAQIS